MPYLDIFGLEFRKTIVIFEISIFKFVIRESLTNTVIFDIGSAFFKGPGSAFREGPCPVWVRFIKYAVFSNYTIFIWWIVSPTIAKNFLKNMEKIYRRVLEREINKILFAMIPIETCSTIIKTKIFTKTFYRV